MPATRCFVYGYVVAAHLLAGATVQGACNASSRLALAAYQSRHDELQREVVTNNGNPEAVCSVSTLSLVTSTGCPKGDAQQIVPSFCPARCAVLFSPWWEYCSEWSAVRALNLLLGSTLDRFATDCFEGLTDLALQCTVDDTIRDDMPGLHRDQSISPSSTPGASTIGCHVDGLQNKDETGVDCGGTRCPPCILFIGHRIVGRA